MPELPEVQTVVNQLNEALSGKVIKSVDVRLPKIFLGPRDQILGSRIKSVKRRAKMVIIDLDGPLSIVVHLKMTGQLIVGAVSDKQLEVSYPNPIPFAGRVLPGKTTHVVLLFNDGSKLFFNDMRQFGWMKVVDDNQLKDIDEKHGPDALSDDFNEDYLAKICSNWGRPIKLLLLEQSKIAGIGNIYANEALWEAGISPMKRGRELAGKQVSGLVDSIKKVLKMGIKYGGSSASDEAFVNAKGEGGHMQEHFVVYQKDGTSCPRCKNTIVRSTIGGRGTFFCPKCQN